MLARVLFVFLFAAAVVSCQQGAGPAPLTDADRAAIGEVTKAFEAAARGGDWAALAALYTEDAVLLPPNAPEVEGRENIREHFASYPPLTRFSLEPLEIDGRGDLAYVRGRYALTMAVSDTQAVDDHGKYLEIRQRQADGSWLYIRDMYSSDVPVSH
jgi:uncharacterized protein (TIGR02246 family)